MENNLERTPSSQKSSEDDINRKELLWENREEKQILQWMDGMRLKQKNHHKKGGLNKKLFYLFGIPNIIIPLIIGGINGVINLSELSLTYLMITNSIIAGLSTFMNFSKKSQLHYEFESKYDEIVVSIEKELSIPKSHRIPADVFIERISIIYNNLNSYAPV